MAADPKNGPVGIDPIVSEAKDRFDRCIEWEGTARDSFLNDLKFAEADSDNGYQWPNAIRRSRDVDERPCLTVNMTRQHNLQIINDAKKNKPEIKYRATGNGATKESADVWQGLARHIEYRSNAQAVYDYAVGYQVKGGKGWWRVVSEYAADDTFDQELRILPVADPLAVYIDPDCIEPDKSDANFAFVFSNIPKDEFDKQHPEWRDMAGQSALGENSYDWIKEDHVRIVEYFRRSIRPDEMMSYMTAQRQRVTVRKSKLPPEVYDTISRSPDARRRPVEDIIVEWYLIVGEKIVEQTEVPCDIIPLVPVIGEETVIEGIYDCKGHTRAMKDPQRIYNYWTSSAVEHVALQSKSPYVAASKAIEGYETYWNNANRVNASVLPYNDWDDDDERQIPPPARQASPEMGQAYISGMQIAREELSQASGQFENSMGQQGNERTGKAIIERQRQGDTATYHYIDGLALAIRKTGVIILKMAPKIYDTERMLRIVAEDGTDYEVSVDPQARQAFQQKRDHLNQVVARVFNPNVGKYEVIADTGPAWASKREEAWNAFTLIMTQAPAFASIIGDIMFREGDFPGAEEAAARLRRMVPPQALGEGPSAHEQQLMVTVQNLQSLLTKALGQVQIAKGEVKAKDQLRDIEAYDAETKRLAALNKLLSLDPEGLRQVIRQLVDQTAGTSLEPVLAASNPALAAGAAPPGASALPQGAAANDQPPVEGARKGADGQWYIPDRRRPGSYLRAEYRAFGSGPQST